jgi:uncharacterized Tic20 family protein
MNEVTIGAPSQDERNLAMLSHLLGIFFHFLGPLIIWLIKKDDSKYVEQEAREALNFQITVIIAYAVASLLVFLLIGFLLFPLIWCLNALFCILGAVAASKGQSYRYPFAIRLLS